ncbi:hypothetical protein N8748_00945 [bacterium]|nr:hypothetical protein [bacterium]MDC1145660.1 hypothetical protein [Candidatus Neomarinimicrobiota bacterium]
MAKKQTFTSKLGKDGKNFKFVKHIKTVTSEESGHIKFVANMVRLDENENIDQAMKRMEEEASVTLAFGESVDTEEVITEDVSAEETQQEVPAVEEAPVEDAPKEEVSAQEEVPVEDAPKEEVPIEQSSEESVPEEDSAEKADESSKE